MKKINIIIIIGLYFFSALNTKASFNDVAPSSPLYPAIVYAKDQGIVSGYSDGSFRPYQAINRAEFTKIIIEATVSEAEIFASNCFPDVKTSEWFAPFVCTAERKGVIQGYEDGYFKPSQNISFVEAAKIISEGFGLEATEDNEIWYRPYVENLSLRKAIPVSINSFDQELTRGEMVEMIFRIREDLRFKDSKIYESGVLRDSKKLEDYGYQINNGQVYFENQLISGADAESFEILDFDCSKYYARDKNNVYLNDEVILRAEPETFIVLGNWFSKDDYSVFFNSQRISGADADTFDVLGGWFGYDLDNYYRQDSTATAEKIGSLDFEPSNIDTVHEIDNYYIDQDFVYYNCSVVAGADARSFELIAGLYAQDQNHIYKVNNSQVDGNRLYVARIDSADRNSFQIVGSPNSSYFKDQTSVFCDWSLISSADPKSFEVLGSEQSCIGYSRDQSTVFYGSVDYQVDGYEFKSLNNAQPLNFIQLDQDYGKDQETVYYRGNKISEADARSFEVLGQGFGKDQDNVYSKGEILPGADPDNFSL